jgi:hypothetical protein
MCPACWELRSRNVTVNQARDSGTRLQTAGLVLGVISLIPMSMCVAVQIASLILNIVAWTKAKEPPASRVRWRPQLGLVLTLVGLTLRVLLDLVGE